MRHTLNWWGKYRFPIVEKRGWCRRCGQGPRVIREHYGCWDCDACIRRFDLVERDRQRRLARKQAAAAAGGAS